MLNTDALGLFSHSVLEVAYFSVPSSLSDRVGGKCLFV
jgi:hypothetical protein